METRRWMTGLLFGAAALLTAVGSLRADDPLRDVKQLYDTAAYEETLVALAQLDDSVFIDQVDEYRALCLLALHRDAEAERAVERLVLRHPLPLDGLNDRSPKFTALYHSVRDRLLPGLANESYRAARASFEGKDYPAAARQFGESLELLRSAEVPAALRDWELLAKEFRVLAEQHMTSVERQPLTESAPVTTVAVVSAVAPSESGPAPAARAESAIATSESGPTLAAVIESGGALAGLAPAPAVAVASAGAPSESGPAPAGVVASAAAPPLVATPFAPVPRVYDMADLDVTPPVVLDQTLPPWHPPLAHVARRTYTGRLQIIVGENGSVTSADILQPSFSTYDWLLLHAVKQWRYGPALKRGKPVQYRRIIDYVLSSDQKPVQR